MKWLVRDLRALARHVRCAPRCYVSTNLRELAAKGHKPASSRWAHGWQFSEVTGALGGRALNHPGIGSMSRSRGRTPEGLCSI